MIRRFLCWLSGPNGILPCWLHKMELVETFDPFTRKLRCPCCSRYFVMSDEHRAILPWDSEIEEITCQIYNIPRTKL